MDYIDRIKAIREDKDITQEELGKIINKSQQGYSHIENKNAKLTIEDLIEICKFFKISSDNLLGITNKKEILYIKNKNKKGGIIMNVLTNILIDKTTKIQIEEEIEKSIKPTKAKQIIYNQLNKNINKELEYDEINEILDENHSNEFQKLAITRLLENCLDETTYIILKAMYKYEINIEDVINI